MDRLSIAIVGCGDFGSYMADLLARLPEYRVVAACDSNATAAEKVASRLGVAPFTSLEECLTKSRAEAAGLFTPNHLHREQALTAADLGRHIFCEKPMATTLRECYEMMDAAERANVRLMVGHKRRLRPQYRTMAEAVHSGRLGRVLAINVNGFHYRDLQGWWRKAENSGGLLSCAGVHDIDFLRHICGEVATVSARSPVKTDHRTDFEDAISVLLQFESGAVATLQVSHRYPLQTFRQAFNVQIVLERGGIFYDPHEFAVHIQRSGGAIESFTFDNEAGFVEAYETELRSFAGWVLHGEAPVLTGWDGLRCVEIMEAARMSAFTGKDVLLPLQPEGLPVPPRPGDIEPELVARGLSMAEGPAFGRSGILYVANCRADFVSRVLPDGAVEKFATTGGKTQGTAVHPDGRLFVTDLVKRTIYQVSTSGAVGVLCDSYQTGEPLRGPNEIALGPNGDVYFTDPDDAWRGNPTGRVSRVLPDGKAEVLAEGLEFSNGLDFSPCQQFLYVADSTRSAVLRARLGATGRLAEPLQVFIQFAPTIRPDGIRFAADGTLYVALFGAGAVVAVDQEGKVNREIRMPGLFPTNIIFRDGALLVCEGQTAAIWRYRLGIEGVPSYAERVWLAAHNTPQFTEQSCT